VNYGVAKMPFSYWQRGLDSYTQVMQIVDAQIGSVLDTLHSLPTNVWQNTVVVFASDHGEYSGAHGFVQGKLGTVYEEAWHIPLIVVDPSDRFPETSTQSAWASPHRLICRPYWSASVITVRAIG
jgi:uncharacterized sulfatase